MDDGNVKFPKWHKEDNFITSQTGHHPQYCFPSKKAQTRRTISVPEAETVLGLTHAGLDAGFGANPVEARPKSKR
jgi:hypothetical protein